MSYIVEFVGRGMFGEGLAFVACFIAHIAAVAYYKLNRSPLKLPIYLLN